MRRTSLVAILVLFLAAVPAFAQETTTWNVDRGHSAANFAVKHFGVSTVRGSFTNIQGAVVIDDKNVANSSVEVTIDTTTVNTDNGGRDRDLKSANFFDVENYPTMTFKSTKVEKVSDGRLKVTGDLTMHGVTKEVVLDVEGPTPAVNAGRGIKRGATATTRINRKDFGLTWNRLAEGIAVVSDEVQITIDLEMNQARAAASGQ